MTAPPLTLAVVAAPGERERTAILAPLKAFNEAVIGAYDPIPVAIVLRDEHGDIAGGLWGRVAFGWLFVELLSVPTARCGEGLGTALMTRAATIAQAHGCTGLWLDTYSFQARGFYERLGFAVIGTIADCPPGHSKYFMARRLDGRLPAPV
jgi:GNAT superfamily N-acetyltransferase